jgi:hypothetical protein
LVLKFGATSNPSLNVDSLPKTFVGSVGWRTNSSSSSKEKTHAIGVLELLSLVLKLDLFPTHMAKLSTPSSITK